MGAQYMSSEAFAESKTLELGTWLVRVAFRIKFF